MDGRVGPAAHLSCEAGGSQSRAAANRHWGWVVQGHTPLQDARSSPLVGPTLGCPHASLPPASLLQLPTSVRHYSVRLIRICLRSSSPCRDHSAPHPNLGTLQVLSTVPALCPAARLVQPTSRCGVVRSSLSPACPRGQYIGTATIPSSSGTTALTPLRLPPGLLHAWTLRVSHFRTLPVSAHNGRAS